MFIADCDTICALQVGMERFQQLLRASCLRWPSPSLVMSVSRSQRHRADNDAGFRHLPVSIEADQSSFPILLVWRHRSVTTASKFRPL